MSKVETDRSWRDSRRESARAAILDAAWAAARDQGLAALSLRDLARRAGITTPTVYAYFDSKNTIYDAMFGQAAEQFADCMEAPYEPIKPRDAQSALVAPALRFVEFCVADLIRYQLLFQRSLPDFAPSSESYAPAVRALAAAGDVLAAHGMSSQRHIDMWTALTTGLVSQQVANDPGGDRWTGLIEEAVAMFVGYYQSPGRRRK